MEGPTEGGKHWMIERCKGLATMRELETRVDKQIVGSLGDCSPAGLLIYPLDPPPMTFVRQHECRTLSYKCHTIVVRKSYCRCRVGVGMIVGMTVSMIVGLSCRFWYDCQSVMSVSVCCVGVIGDSMMMMRLRAGVPRHVQKREVLDRIVTLS